ncbi:MAG: nitroreductase family protein [Hyphomonadaceae bacterium]|nr:nitroreductase family protein [Hyphomonadaceae bacterium]
MSTRPSACTRRSVLAALAAAPFASSCTFGALPDPVAAWRSPGAGETDLRRFALAHAILAPNPHNRQPWLVAFEGDDAFTLHADTERLLPETDPFDRQIVVGCGAFLELLDLAAGSKGKKLAITLWPEGEPQPRLDQKPVAHVRVTSEPATLDPLFAHILARRTDRNAFLDRAVTDEDLAAIAAAAVPMGESKLVVRAANSGELRDKLRALSWNAFDKECRTPRAHGETVRLTRIGRVEIAHERDGIALSGPVIETAHALGLFNQRTFADVDHPFTRQGLDAIRPVALDAPAHMWITSADNTRSTQIAAGRAYARLNLAATSRSLAMQPWSQALQEYPEMAALHAEAEQLMGAPGDTRVQMFVRVGYPEAPVPPAPRRGVHALFESA